MRRRTILAALPVAFAGCAGAGGPGTRPSPNPSETSSGTESPDGSESPTVVDRSLTPGESSCANEESGEATVEFTESTVRVSGTLVTPTPCHGATLRSATYDAEADELRFVVAPSSPTTNACMQCLGAREYGATVRFEGGLPGRVEVVHDGSGGERTVATATR